MTARNERIASYPTVAGLGWIVIIDRPAETALAGLIRQRDFIFLVLAIAAGAGLRAGVFAAAKLAAPLQALAEAVGGFAEGREVTLPKTEITELQTLSSAFAEMRARIVARTAERVQALTELKFLNESLEKAAGAADAANRAKSIFLSTMSHEIRTPMNAILGYAQLMLRDPALGPDAKANLKIIGRSGEHLLALINDVLDMSKIEAGRINLNPVTFRLPRLLEDLSTMFRLRAAAKALQFELSMEGESIPYVVADQGKIRQTLINLLGNAIKFTERGQIKLHIALTQKSDDRLWLSAHIEDTGVGMSDLEQRELFEPFSQIGRGSHTHEGSGLGLAISRKFARLMGGDITVISRPDAGSLFRFEIPIERGDVGVTTGRIGPPAMLLAYAVDWKHPEYWLSMTNLRTGTG